ncbi:FtsK/SpoIIIE family DNA translocase [Aquimarina agarilytica]|uniref:FtsK/SpoIIIE family DNA translocase n=1 Tax=Aquimarina agarilytica TaxID=1087449 RepID=UPI000288B940|nr:DNA translocase FtsK [Aquimarina agarilytica]
MALKKSSSKSTTKKTKKTTQKKVVVKKQLSEKQRLLLGGGFILLGVAVLISLISYFFTWQADQSIINGLERDIPAKNLLQKFGAFVGNLLVFEGFGIMSFIFSGLLVLTGITYFFGVGKAQLKKRWFWGLYLVLLGSVILGFFNSFYGLLSGVVGFEINDYLQDYVGKIGAILILTFFGLLYLIFRLNLTPSTIQEAFSKTKNTIKKDMASSMDEVVAANTSAAPLNTGIKETLPPEVDLKISNPSKTEVANESDESGLKVAVTEPETSLDDFVVKEGKETKGADDSFSVEIPKEEPLSIEVETAVEEEEEVENLSKQLVEDFGEFDPKLELGNYKFPTIELLKDYSTGQNNITIDQGELEENKNKIVETLKNYKIEIAHIKATIGPTVTLYEIVPEAGVRISKIKNLEDDIALSLAALGIRIIAPIPGKGTIGIEVPNKKSTIVSMRSAIASAKFQSAEMELPISFGKTISNETFVVDLAKMPHLLMAGATGQGKSVGLNAILTSLLYKKHPAEVKFVLVDPKKVELTLFNKIERHFLAKLPDSEEAIITDNTKVINTLNSLCIEMDARYELLKNAYVRNIKEYNTKFKARKLNPENGHRFLPYIVLVIDEFADLIMTAGKEVETPIARLAQLARAIGIHLIIATQRPSVNVITGMIKANFPARLAFRVMSKIDSRTILDTGGADQLIGRGDMLYNNGNNVIRVQCAFVDTPEVERITNYIGAQKAYPDAHLLPEYVGEESGTNLDIDVKDRDALFREAAEVIVTAQQGSASLLQRKLKLGYNRAGRIIDQLEAAGIVGPFEGSKARQVLIPDLVALEQFLAEGN